MAYTVQFAGQNDDSGTHTFERAIDALALASELLARVQPPLVYIQDHEGRDISLDELGELAKKEE